VVVVSADRLPADHGGVPRTGAFPHGASGILVALLRRGLDPRALPVAAALVVALDEAVAERREAA
jgi:hypothetical protein